MVIGVIVFAFSFPIPIDIAIVLGVSAFGDLCEHGFVHHVVHTLPLFGNAILNVLVQRQIGGDGQFVHHSRRRIACHAGH